MITSRLRREDQLLVCIARRSLNDFTARQIRKLLHQESLDWGYIAAAATRHALQGLLALHLESFAADLPDAVRLQLQDVNQENSHDSLFLAGELTKIVSALQDHDTPSIPFKGPTLAQTVYDDLGIRQFADLDLFVQHHDLARVKQILAAQGFTPVRNLSDAREAALLRFDNAYAFRKEPGVFLDVHWRFAPTYFAFRIETDDLWRRLEPVNIGRQTLFTLSPEDLLMVLCCHGFTHQWERLVWICDVATLVERRKDFDWEYLFETARRLGVLRIVLLGLFLAAEVLGASLPASAQERLQNEKAVRNVGEETSTRLFAPQTNRTGVFHSIGQQLRMRERRRDRIRSLLAFFLMPREYDLKFVSIPASLSILYYLVRPIRWGVQRGRNLIKREP